MDIKNFLLADKSLNRSELARRMWPGNKKPESYLSSKLMGSRPFTRRDAERALAIIRQMAWEFSHLAIEQDYPNPTPGPKSHGRLGRKDQLGTA